MGLVAVVKALQGSPRAAAAVPEAQRHYLSAAILPSGWYPERDYNALIGALAGSVDRSTIPDIWSHFGRAAARRDIGGDQEQVAVQSRTELVGIYRKLRGQPNDIAGLCMRIAKIWSMYHDSGRVMFARHPRLPYALQGRLLDFQFPIRGHADLQTAFAIEFGRLSGIELSGKLERFGEGTSGCDWCYQLTATPENLASVANLAVEA